jgi:hypothetical protein
MLACSGAAAAPIGGSSDPTVPPHDVDGSVTEPDPDAPHALGSISIRETHESGSTSRHTVTASFLPEAPSASITPGNVAGCELIAPSPSAPRSPEGFDAGPLAISGTTEPITLSPPYVDRGETAGVPFDAGAKLRVQALGAAGAGFEAFDETFTATQLVETTPPVAKLARGVVFGAGVVPITWIAGTDPIWIGVAGTGGSLRCAADDKQGRFEVPREVIKAALGGATRLTFSVVRERTETKKSKKTRGELGDVVVRPRGWLALSTSSTETASFQCSGAECTGVVPSPCDTCSGSMCKAELDACAADATCPLLRGCLDTCPDTACRNACFVKWPDLAAKTKNGAVYKCQCVAKCVSACSAECR